MKKQDGMQAQKELFSAKASKARQRDVINLPVPKGFKQLSSGILVPTSILKGGQR